MHQMGGYRKNSSPEVVLTDEDFEQLSPDQQRHWAGYTYRMSFEVVTPESAEAGDAEERGWEVEDGGTYESLEDLLRQSDVRYKGWLQWSSSSPGPESWISSEPDQDFSTGADTTYDLFIERVDKKPLTQDEIHYIWDTLNVYPPRKGHARNSRRRAPLKPNNGLDAFTRGYLEAALFSTNDESRDDGGDPLDKNYSIADFAPEALEHAKRDCAKFQRDNADALADFDDGEAGGDFWFTRNGHGVGFWDGDYPEPQATELSESAEKFGGVWLYVGDDGLIYST